MPTSATASWALTPDGTYGYRFPTMNAATGDAPPPLPPADPPPPAPPRLYGWTYTDDGLATFPILNTTVAPTSESVASSSGVSMPTQRATRKTLTHLRPPDCEAGVSGCAAGLAQPALIATDIELAPEMLSVRTSRGGFTLDNGTKLMRIAFGDVDGDGDLDLLYVGFIGPCIDRKDFTDVTTPPTCGSSTGHPGETWNTPSTAWYLNDGRGGLTKSSSWSLGLPSYPEMYDLGSAFPADTVLSHVSSPSLVLADYDLDGTLDVAVGKTLYKNRGETIGWAEERTFDATVRAIADLTGDGYPDVIIQQHTTTFMTSSVNSCGSDHPCCNKCRSDNHNPSGGCVSGGICTNGLRFLRNDQAGGFVSETILGEGGKWLLAADLDNDGDVDLLAGGRSTANWANGLKVYLNNGTGTFTVQTPGKECVHDELGLAPGAPATPVDASLCEHDFGMDGYNHVKDWALGDLNGDGLLDLVIIREKLDLEFARSSSVYMNEPKEGKPVYFKELKNSGIGGGAVNAIALGGECAPMSGTCSLAHSTSLPFPFVKREARLPSAGGIHFTIAATHEPALTPPSHVCHCGCP